MNRPLSAKQVKQAKTLKEIVEARKAASGAPPPIADWIESNVYDWTTVSKFSSTYDFSTAKKICLQPYQREILTKILTPDEKNLFPYSEVVWSQPKKHGKTQIAAAVGAWFAENVEPPNVIYTLASNQEQSSGLIFNSLLPTVEGLGGKTPNTIGSVPIVQMVNGTQLRAIPASYEGQAGGNYGLTLWSELWTYKSERDRRLWEELPPVPTRKNSIRWVETYAGFENESELLLDLFLRVFTNTSETEVRKESPSGNKVEPVPGLEHITTQGRPSCWHIPEEGLFIFWDHEIRAPWITEKYIRSQKSLNRTSTYIRLWENRWQSSKGTYIDPYMYDDCVTLEKEELGPMILAGDASQRHDTTALVGVQKIETKIFGKPSTRYKVRLVRVWDPQGKDIDLDETIANYVYQMYKKGLLLGAFRYDPFQMHQVAVNLRKRGVPCKEFNQGKDRLSADTFLWQQFKDGTIDLYPHQTLEAHVKAANASEYENGQVRIVKGTASSMNKVDAAVALSMAVWAAANKRSPKPRKQVMSKSWSSFE